MEAVAIVIVIIAAWMLGAASHDPQLSSRTERVEVSTHEPGHVHERPRDACQHNSDRVIQRNLTQQDAQLEPSDEE